MLANHSPYTDNSKVNLEKKKKKNEGCTNKSNTYIYLYNNGKMKNSKRMTEKYFFYILAIDIC